MAADAGARPQRRRYRRGYRLHPSELWSVFVLVLSVPIMLLWLAVIGMVAQWTGVELGSPQDAGRERLLNLVYMALVVGTLGIGVVTGRRAWRLYGSRVGQVCAALNATLAVGFVLLPIVLSTLG